MTIFSKPAQLYLGKVYCIYNDLYPSDMYIGSTFNLKLRTRDHKSVCNNIKSSKYNRKIYKFIREHGNWDNWKIKILKYVIARTSRELEKYEDEFIVLHKPTLNSQRAKRSSKEWYKDNSEERKKYSRDYKLKHSDIINKKSECACGGRFVYMNKSRHNKSKRHNRFVNQGIIYTPKNRGKK